MPGASSMRLGPVCGSGLWVVVALFWPRCVVGLQAPASRTWAWSGGGTDVDIHYSVSGAASATTCVVLCPGFGAGSFQFEAISTLLGERGVRCYAMDWFGQGRSWPRTAAAGSRFGVECWGSQLCDFLASEVVAAHETVLVGGNSVGGLASCVAAAREGTRCDGLYLLNPTPFWSFWGPAGSPWWDGTLPAPAPLRAVASLWFDALRSPAVVRSLLSQVYARAAKGCEMLDLEGSPYLSALRFPTLVSQAHMVWTEVIISPQGLVR